MDATAISIAVSINEIPLKNLIDIVLDAANITLYWPQQNSVPSPDR
jgi:hypothetical protein